MSGIKSGYDKYTCAGVRDFCYDGTNENYNGSNFCYDGTNYCCDSTNYATYIFYSLVVRGRK